MHTDMIYASRAGAQPARHEVPSLAHPSLGGAQAVQVRPLRADDAPLVQRFVGELSPQSRRRRFFTAVRQLSAAQLRALTCPEDHRDLALGAFAEEYDGPRIVALAQCTVVAGHAAEIAVAVADAWQRRGLGARLMRALVQHARGAGLAMLHGTTLADNWSMLALAARHGFDLVEHEDPELMRIRRWLSPEPGNCAERGDYSC